MDTPTETEARRQIRQGFLLLFYDPEHARGYDEILACAESELEAVYDGWLAENTQDLRELFLTDGEAA